MARVSDNAPYGPGNSDYEFECRRDDAERDLVDQAFRDILAAKFESDAVRAVMNRRAGDMSDYLRMKEWRAVAERAARHSGAT